MIAQVGVVAPGMRNKKRLENGMISDRAPLLSLALLLQVFDLTGSKHDTAELHVLQTGRSRSVQQEHVRHVFLSQEHKRDGAIRLRQDCLTRGNFDSRRKSEGKEKKT